MFEHKFEDLQILLKSGIGNLRPAEASSSEKIFCLLT